MSVKVVIPGEPRAKQRPRFANGHAYTPKTTREAEELIRWHLRAARVPRNEQDDLWVQVTFFRGSKRRCDADNLLKLVLDSANGIAWKDDSQVKRLSVLVRAVERSEARTEVAITPLAA